MRKEEKMQGVYNEQISLKNSLEKFQLYDMEILNFESMENSRVFMNGHQGV